MGIQDRENVGERRCRRWEEDLATANNFAASQQDNGPERVWFLVVRPLCGAVPGAASAIRSGASPAAWVRTGLASLASGIGAKKLLEGVVPGWMIITTGSLLVLFSAFCFVVAVWREMFPGAPPPEPDTRQIPPTLLIIANGFLTLVALAALMSTWFGRTGGN